MDGIGGRTAAGGDAPEDVPAGDRRAMREVDAAFWVNEIQEAGGRGADFERFRLTGVDRLVVTTSVMWTDRMTEREARAHVMTPTTILTLDAPGVLSGRDLYEAVWAAYVLSLEATMDAGNNRRAHVGDGSCVALARAVVARLGAVATPCDRCYASGGTYLEGIGHSYEPATRTLTVEPSIGS